MKKRKILPILALIWSVLFGPMKSSSSRPKSSHFEKQPVHKTVGLAGKADSKLESTYSTEEIDALDLDRTEGCLVLGSSNPSRGYPDLMETVRADREQKLAKPSQLPTNIEGKNKIVLIEIKADLRSEQWINDFINSINRGGSDSKNQDLIRKILSRMADAGIDTENVNKILIELRKISLKATNAALEVIFNEKLMRILAELEKPFTHVHFPDLPTGSSDILGLGLPQVEGFGRSLSTLSPVQQRAFIRRQLAATPNKNNEVFTAKVFTARAHNGAQGILTDKSTNHLLSKHGKDLGINDPLPPNPNQKTTKYEQPRTRINTKNKMQFRKDVQRILANEATTDIYENVSIRGIKGDVYHCTETDVVIGIHTEGKFKGEIKKVQPISPEQLEKLKTSKSID